MSKKVIKLKLVDNKHETSSNLHVAVVRDEGRRELGAPYDGANQRISPRRVDELQEYKLENERLRHRNANFVIPVKEEVLYYGTILAILSIMITWFTLAILKQ